MLISSMESAASQRGARQVRVTRTTRDLVAHAVLVAITNRLYGKKRISHIQNVSIQTIQEHFHDAYCALGAGHQ